MFETHFRYGVFVIFKYRTFCYHAHVETYETLAYIIHDSLCKKKKKNRKKIFAKWENVCTFVRTNGSKEPTQLRMTWSDELQKKSKTIEYVYALWYARIDEFKWQLLYRIIIIIIVIVKITCSKKRWYFVRSDWINILYHFEKDWFWQCRIIRGVKKKKKN